ncbi:MAG: hypothetical protein R3B68_10170 [Phycisphaerales bacterium]
MGEEASSVPETASLSEQMRKASAEAREHLGAFGLSADSYDGLLRMSGDAEASLRERGALRAAARLDALRGTFAAALERPTDDLEARGEAYLSLLESVLIASLGNETESPAWSARLDRAFADGAPGVGELSLLTTAGMCRDVGASIEAARTPETDDGLLRVMWRKWRFGLAPAAAGEADAIAPGVREAGERLRAARLAGLVSVDLAGAVCPERRPVRATHADAGAAELRDRLDRLLRGARASLIGTCDRDHVLGVVGSAFLAVHIVPNDQVAFITAYRFMSLMDPSDPRERTLGRLRDAFDGIG